MSPLLKRKELLILIGIVLFDLVTKLTANYYLPFEENVHISDNVSLYLTYNDEAVGGQAEYLLEQEEEIEEGQENKNLRVILSCVSGLLLLCYILFIRQRNLKLIYKILLGIIISLTLSFFVEVILMLYWDVEISTWAASVVGKLTGLILYYTIFYFSTNVWIRTSTLFILACGVGNLISHFYLPFRVIDFINIHGSYELLKIGVFNFADLSFDIGAVGLVISCFIVLFRNISRKRFATEPIQMNK